MIDLVKKLKSQIGDDVCEIYSHEALFSEAAAEITRLRAALADAQAVGFAAGVAAAATLVETHAYTSGSKGISLEPSEMAKHDMHHHTIATAIRALTPPEQNRSES